MDLPFRIQSDPGTDRVISVDGVCGAPGLHLSHWPGNRTPPFLKHDLSTGIAMNFAKLDAEKRQSLVEGCGYVVNNHYDTDGVCALAFVLRPEEALQREEKLLAAAAAGDFFGWPSDEALAIDAILSGVVDVERSPWRARFAGLSDAERYELCTLEALERLAGWVDGGGAEVEALWRPALDQARMDREDLAECTSDDLVHLDFRVWTAKQGAASKRPDTDVFDPGRHALFGGTTADRVLAIGPHRGGTTYRFLLGTRSWFDLASPPPPPRPDLARLSAALNAKEGTAPEEEVCWRHHPEQGASPELWFGRGGHPSFPEYATPVLARSGLAPELVKSVVLDALRATWVFPEESDEVAAGA